MDTSTANFPSIPCAYPQPILPPPRNLSPKMTWRIALAAADHAHQHNEFSKMLILPEPAPAANFPTIPCALVNKHTLNIIRR